MRWKWAVSWIASLTVVLGAGAAAAQQEAEQQSGLPEITEGSLVFRSPVSGRYDFVPLAHSDVSIDVRGLVASTTVVQRYANTTDQAIEAVYVFPLPPDGEPGAGGPSHQLVPADQGLERGGRGGHRVPRSGDRPQDSAEVSGRADQGDPATGRDLPEAHDSRRVDAGDLLSLRPIPECPATVRGPRRGNGGAERR